MRMIMFIVGVVLPMLGNSQVRNNSSSVDSSMRFVYIEEVYLGSMITSAYDANSIYQNKRYTHINECYLSSGLSNLKVQTVEVIGKNFASIVGKLREKKVYLSICFLPRYDGTIADVWFVWKGTCRLLTEDEMERLTLELKRLRVSFDGRGIYDTPYCQILSFGIFPKDLE